MGDWVAHLVLAVSVCGVLETVISSMQLVSDANI